MWGILTGVTLLIILVYLRLNLIIVVPLCITVICIFNGMSPFEILTGPFAEGAASFISDFLFIFLLGAILGRIMKDSGAAETLARHVFKVMGEKYAAAAVFMTAALLGYGGIVSFVIIFALLPIGRSVFKKAGLSEVLLPACIGGGISGFAVMAPGSPQIQNIIPMEYLGTGSMAGAWPGFAAAAVSSVLIVLYLNFRTKKLKLRRLNQQTETAVSEDKAGRLQSQKSPGIMIAPIPLLVVIILLAFFQLPPVLALFSGTLAALLLFFRKLPSILETINSGTRDAVVPLLYAASAVGFGLTLRSFPAFLDFTGSLLRSSLNPYFIAAVITNLAAAAMGSAAGGILVALSVFGPEFIAGTDPAVLHRVLTMSSSVFDTFPHNNVYLAMLVLANLSIKETYKDFFVTTVLAPLAGLAAAFGLLFYII